MASVYDVLGKADQLCSSLQGLIDGGSFDDYRDFLEGLQQQVIASRESLSDRNSDGSAEIGETAADRLDAAIAAANGASPNDDSLSNLEACCNAAATAMDAA